MLARPRQVLKPPPQSIRPEAAAHLNRLYRTFRNKCHMYVLYFLTFYMLTSASDASVTLSNPSQASRTLAAVL